jgi:imidazolonepropionase-like amidohydrolase
MTPFRKMLAALLALLIAAPALADTLVDNVNGYTMKSDGRLHRFNGMVLDDQGRVKQLLTARDRRPERSRFRLEGRGRTLIPGLIDAPIRARAGSSAGAGTRSAGASAVSPPPPISTPP